tara:strand:- start:44 stop:592 length:549 start_codon:yes stop_codon:yes gene_type:complete
VYFLVVIFPDYPQTFPTSASTLERFFTLLTRRRADQMFSQAKVRLAHLSAVLAARLVRLLVSLFLQVSCQKLQRLVFLKAIKAFPRGNTLRHFIGKTGGSFFPTTKIIAKVVVVVSSSHRRRRRRRRRHRARAAFKGVLVAFSSDGRQNRSSFRVVDVDVVVLFHPTTKSFLLYSHQERQVI